MADAPDGSGSRWGVRGSEDLGGGLKANFNFEAGFSSETGLLDNASPALFQRVSYVGMSGGFGEVRLGRQYTVGFAGSIWAMPATSVSSILGAGLGFNGAGSRSSSQIRYISPSFGGLTVHIAHVLNGDDTAAVAAPLTLGANPGQSELGLIFASGPFTANFTASSFRTGLPSANAGGTAFGLNGSYNFGVASVRAGYIDRAGSGTGKGAFIGVQGNFGAFDPWFQVARNTDAKVTAYEFGSNYALSKRTRLYGVVGRNNAGAGATTIGIGAAHSF
jgi:predicted porin